MIFKTRKDFLTQNDWLWYLSNDLGCTNLQICGGGKNSKGDTYFTKRYNYFALNHIGPWDKIATNVNNDIFVNRKTFIEKATHRSILDIELCIDIDEPGDCKTIKEKAIQICKLLKEHDINYACYWTGSKSYHIHCFDAEFRKFKNADKFKQLFLRIIGADGMKVGKQMIALEGAPHYRSGQPKQEVDLIGNC